MAIYTDFFIATEEELLAAFPFRYPVAKRPKRRKTKNPFTGEAVTVETWEPAKPYPPQPPDTIYPSREELLAVQKLPCVQFKGADPVKLASLWSILGGGETLELVNEFRPALLAPNAESSFLNRLPLAWCTAIAGIEAVAPIARLWATTDELKFDRWKLTDAREVIKALQELAIRAIAESKGMFLWVNV